ncbi:hypothetical protein GGR56DRAFT_687980 [Xylariaceae sp. FL0804]|nr:hypothetical protein GGR56DRAFT_687980 [Xylariaceae sp. FL0804]
MYEVDDWDTLLDWIVHRGQDIQRHVHNPLPDDCWTLDPKPFAFPFDVEETWWCAAAILVILAVHLEIDTEFLLECGLRYYLLRVAWIVVWTVAISFISTFAFEILGNVLDWHREEYLYTHLDLRLRARLIKRFGWGPLTRDGFPEPFVDTVVGLAHLACNYCALVVLDTAHSLFRLLGWVLVQALRLLDHTATLPNLALGVSAYLALPTPGFGFGFFGGTDGTDGTDDDPSAILWQWGAAAAVQLCVAVGLWLTAFYHAARAQYVLIAGPAAEDPYETLLFHLFRATAVHLIAYTAYQLVCASVATCGGAFGFAWGPDYYNVPIRPGDRGGEIIPRFSVGDPGRPLAAALLLAAHWLLGRLCAGGVRLLRPLWEYYTDCGTHLTRHAMDLNFPRYCAFMDADLAVLRRENRVLARAGMTALFGLQSSWPARMKLSPVAQID